MSARRQRRRRTPRPAWWPTALAFPRPTCPACKQRHGSDPKGAARRLHTGAMLNTATQCEVNNWRLLRAMLRRAGR